MHRNLSVCGEQDVCEKMVSDDVMTPLTALLGQVSLIIIIITLYSSFLQKRYKALTNTKATKQKRNYMFYRQNNAINNDSI